MESRQPRIQSDPNTGGGLTIKEEFLERAECSTVKLPGTAQLMCFHSSTAVPSMLRVSAEHPEVLCIREPTLVSPMSLDGV